MLDIEYLLLLQRFRIAINDALTPFFEWLSNFAVSYLLLVPVLIYWAIHKKRAITSCPVMPSFRLPLR
ncbi:MAG: hypothetical protein VZR26_04365 [Erysipelotrichaceae bacterium]|nr:hypothetical protein [Erysipelotrichaceae bacterium]